MPSGTCAASPTAPSVGVFLYAGTTTVTWCPSRASARGSAPPTSARPPVLANGRASGVMKRMFSLSVLGVLTGLMVLTVLVLGVLGVLFFRGARGFAGAFGAFGALD